MTHNEWQNEQSAWFNGSVRTETGGSEPKRYPWVPDYIVVDEDILKLGSTKEESSSSEFSSLGRIIASVHSGLNLSDAVWVHRPQVLHDAATNQKPRSPSPELPFEEYVAVSKQIKASSNYSEILARLEDYCRTDDATFLEGMWVAGNSIKWLPLPAAAERYAGIPTLFLDATAHPDVVHRLLPKVQFHRIAVRQSADIRLFQMSNMAITKRWLNKPSNLPVLVKGLKEVSEKYRNVGLITYMQIGEDKKFDETLAKQVGATSWTHFGNLRGLNTMQDVDCLLIVGRHSLPVDTLSDYARAIFNIDEEWKSTYVDQPVRMKDGRTFSLNTMMPENPWHRAIYEHTSIGETLQAIGRGRLVHGPKKDVYVFSNENLTVNTEVAEFFTFEQYFVRPVPPSRKPKALVTLQALEKVRQRGFVQLIRGDMAEQLDLSDNQVRSSQQKEQIVRELIAYGALKKKVKVRYKKGNTVTRPYLIFDMDKLKQSLESNLETLLELQDAN